ncbi:MAG: hypothetical protein A2Y67_01960 [Candidatus Buchananbacteria bacterium RBG_13_39_9]|uniref:TraC-like domain-containing protein n=1 Tax=Candidatus Buchananbacteria bacterium RBG_13_39_9 TaxID=1797531 RepID=A0A1G1XQA6_9BACT|nr:MAG: hypothetical protein A2Y67_01960 [Candidatus Buchananbacteria bacterium RBG_13_39_9]
MANKKNSTQRYLDIAEIREDTIVMKDSSLSMIIMCSSVNFALKSVDEQDALIYGYMEFLNSLEFPMQIVIQSRKLDIDGYLRQLKEAQKVQTNDLLKMQISGYLDFIKELIEIGEIMTKRFYIIVPYSPFGNKAKGFWSRAKELFSPGQLISVKKEKFLKYRQELTLRIENIQTRLKSLGLDTAILDTQGLIELLYNTYNPKTSENQKLRDISQLNVS